MRRYGSLIKIITSDLLLPAMIIGHFSYDVGTKKSEWVGIMHVK